MVPRRRQEPDETTVDTADRYVHTRRTDYDRIARFSEFLERYKFLGWIILIGFLAIGFDFKTPAQTTRSLQVQIDTVNLRIKELTKANEKLDVLIKLQCNSSQVSNEAKLLFCPPR